MKKIIIMSLVLVLSVSCKAQDIEPLKRGHTIGIVVDSDETKAIVNAGGKSLIINGKLDKGIEYDLVYEIVEKRTGGVMVVNLIGAEVSARQNAKNRAELMKLMSVDRRSSAKLMLLLR